MTVKRNTADWVKRRQVGEPMAFNPHTGKNVRIADRMRPRAWRHEYAGLVWLYDPYTGKPRTDESVWADPYMKCLG